MENIANIDKYSFLFEWVNDNSSYDLHNHTEYSDWVYSISEIIKLAVERWITHFSITDHDNINAYTKWNTLEIAEKYWLNIIPWVEVSIASDIEWISNHFLTYFDKELLKETKFIKDINDSIWQIRWKEFLEKRIEKINNVLSLGLSLEDFSSFTTSKCWYAISTSTIFKVVSKKFPILSKEKVFEMIWHWSEAYLEPWMDFSDLKYLTNKYSLPLVFAHSIADFHTDIQKNSLVLYIKELIKQWDIDWLEMYHPDISEEIRNELKLYNVLLHTVWSDTHTFDDWKLPLKNYWIKSILNPNYQYV